MGCAVLAAASGCAASPSVPASATTATVSDPVADGLKGPRLDVTALKVTSRADAIVTTISVVRVVHGDVGLYLASRTKTGVSGVVVATHHRRRGDKSKVLDVDRVVKCPGLRVTWSEATNQVRLLVPAECVAHGSYEAVKVKVITEVGNGADADFAPSDSKGKWHWTPWVNRS
jgi:hypothetical protein